MKMKLGMYSIEIERPSVGELFEAAAGYGFTCMQFDFSSVGEEQMPLHIQERLLKEIRRCADENGIEIVAVNGTFNMIHPDREVRLEGLRRLETIAAACAALGSRIVTLCTGSRDKENMWKRHEDNDRPEAMEDLKENMGEALRIAQRYDVILGIECEPSNCIDSARKAEQLLEYFQHDSHLGIIMDAANLFRKGQAKRENVRNVISDAFGRLGKSICLAHGKDICEGEDIHYTHAGNGMVDFPFFMDQLRKADYEGCMVLHGIKAETDFPGAVSFMEQLTEQ